MGGASEDRSRRARWRALDSWTARYRELRGHCGGLPGPWPRHAEGRFGDPLGAASNLLSRLRRVHRGYAAVARVPIAGKNIACRVVGSAVAVCDIHAEESDREPGGRPLHRARARVHAADAGEETRRISDEIVHLVPNPRSAQGQTRKSIPAIFSSALPSAADIVRSARHVRFVPEAEVSAGGAHRRGNPESNTTMASDRSWL